MLLSDQDKNKNHVIPESQFGENSKIHNQISNGVGKKKSSSVYQMLLKIHISN